MTLSAAVRRLPPFLALAITLGAGPVLQACATDAPKPPVCDGAHRRPVNLYPSVLGPGEVPVAPKAPSPSGAPAAPTPLSTSAAAAHGGC